MKLARRRYRLSRRRKARRHRRQNVIDALRSVVPSISRQFVLYGVPFTAVDAGATELFSGQVEVPTADGPLWNPGAWQNDPTWWYPLSAQIPYQQTSYTANSAPGLQSFRVTRRIQPTRLTGRIYIRIARTDAAVRFVIGRYKKPVQGWLVGGPKAFPATTGSTDVVFFGVPGSNWSAGNTPPIYCGVNNSWLTSITPGDKNVGWPVINSDQKTSEVSMDPNSDNFNAEIIPGPFNTVLTFNNPYVVSPGGTTVAAGGNKQFSINPYYGQQFTFLGGAGRDFEVLYTCCPNTINSLADKDADAGGNKQVQVIDFDIDLRGGPRIVYEKYIDYEQVGGLLHTEESVGVVEPFRPQGIGVDHPLVCNVSNTSSLGGTLVDATYQYEYNTDEFPQFDDQSFTSDMFYQNHLMMGFCCHTEGPIDRTGAWSPWLNWGGQVVLDYESVYDNASRNYSFRKGIGFMGTRS